MVSLRVHVAMVGSAPVVVCLLLALCGLVQLLHVSAFHEIEQREGLIALFEATNGDGWTTNEGWNTQADECTWDGVVCKNGWVRELHLSKNNLYGTLPGKFFAELPHLRSLFLQNNRIYYTLPPEVGHLTNAAFIWMHENKISGSIPEEFGQLGGHLQQLYLSDNLFDSTIPSELGNLASLRDLQIGDNRLVGTLPSQVFDLPKLQVFQANENHLEGTVPSNLATAAKLQNLRLDENQLEGNVVLPAGPFKELRLEKNRLTISNAEGEAMCSRKVAGALSECVVLPQNDAPEL